MNDFTRKTWKESFKGFYQKYSRPLWFFIFKTCGNENMADDIFQESFYRYLKAEPIKLNEHQQKAYLFKIAYRLVIDHIRKMKVEQKNLSEALLKNGLGYEKSLEPEITLALDMEQTFQLLKPKERTLLWLAYVEGYSHQEIAAITNSREKALKVRLFRLRKKFAGILYQKGYPGPEKPEPKSVRPVREITNYKSQITNKPQSQNYKLQIKEVKN